MATSPLLATTQPGPFPEDTLHIESPDTTPERSRTADEVYRREVERLTRYLSDFQTRVKSIEGATISSSALETALSQTIQTATKIKFPKKAKLDPQQDPIRETSGKVARLNSELITSLRDLKNSLMYSEDLPKLVEMLLTKDSDMKPEIKETNGTDAIKTHRKLKESIKTTEQKYKEQRKHLNFKIGQGSALNQPLDHKIELLNQRRLNSIIPATAYTEITTRYAEKYAKRIQNLQELETVWNELMFSFYKSTLFTNGLLATKDVIPTMSSRLKEIQTLCKEVRNIWSKIKDGSDINPHEPKLLDLQKRLDTFQKNLETNAEFIQTRINSLHTIIENPEEISTDSFATRADTKVVTETQKSILALKSEAINTYKDFENQIVNSWNATLLLLRDTQQHLLLIQHYSGCIPRLKDLTKRYADLAENLRNVRKDSLEHDQHYKAFGDGKDQLALFESAFKEPTDKKVAIRIAYNQSMSELSSSLIFNDLTLADLAGYRFTSVSPENENQLLKDINQMQATIRKSKEWLFEQFAKSRSDFDTVTKSAAEEMNLKETAINIMSKYTDPRQAYSAKTSLGFSSLLFSPPFTPPSWV